MSDTYVHRGIKPSKPTEPGDWHPCTNECCEGWGEYYVTHNGWTTCGQCRGRGWVNKGACTNCHGTGVEPGSFMFGGGGKCRSCGGSGKKRKR